MLRDLFIQNLAIIEQARIEFGPGLNILTGETGAGKSLLVGALELVWGERARGEWIRSGADEARVEAVFDTDDVPEISEVLQEAGFPVEESLVIRRTVTRAGKNRIYINDRPGTLGFLERLGLKLVDIHGQHEHQSLLKISRHQDLVDRFGGLVPLRDKVAGGCRALQELRERLAHLEAEQREMLSERDMAVFQQEELARAGLRAGEEEELEQEKNKLQHGERLRQICHEADELFTGEPRPLVDTVGYLLKQVQEASRLDPRLSGAADLLESGRHYLEEAAQQLQQYASTADDDPSLLEQIEERLDLLYRLKRKYRRSVEELISLAEELQQKIYRLDHFETEREALQESIDREEKQLRQDADKLSRGRKKCGLRLESEVKQELGAVGMKETGFRVSIQPLPSREEGRDDGKAGRSRRRIEPSGMDRVEFLLRPNPGQPDKPLHRIASGGELSRVMLAMRNVLRRSDSLSTLIFDEVDAGIGGAEAEAVGSRLKALSKNFQVLCVTHLPQIAAFGDSHYKVSKQVGKDHTGFHIQPLDKAGREEEVARMLGGAKITGKTLAHAREMLQQAAAKESK